MELTKYVCNMKICMHISIASLIAYNFTSDLMEQLESWSVRSLIALIISTKFYYSDFGNFRITTTG